jgi:transcriptional regulator with XRE-family HTH domain
MNDKKVRQKFGKRLREIRKTKGFSQESLGDEAGLHRTYIGSIERGEQNISLENIHKLAKALRIRPDELLK